MIRAMYAQVLAPGIDHNFVEFLDLKHRDRQYDKIFNIDNTTRAFEDEVQFAGTGPAPELTEGENVAYYDLIQGGTKRYVPLKYAMGARTSYELIQDDLYGIIKQAPKALAHSISFTEEMVPWNIFNNGFSTVVTTDGVSLFNNAHPLLGGVNATNTGPGLANVISTAGTYPNRPLVDLDISFTAIQLMTNHFNRMTDSMGLPVHMRPTMLVIPPELIFTCRELLGSPGKPYTADNEINALTGEELRFVVSSYLTSATAWFAVTEKEHHQLKFKWRKQVDTDYDDDFDTQAVKMLTYMRIAAGATHWIGTWGSNGP
jgi:phage major head subunit gpT-like protein